MDSPDLFRLFARQKLRQQPMKMVYAVLAPYTVATAAVGARAQVSLHGLADCDVFALYLVTEFHRSAHGLSGRLALGITKVPLENGKRPFRAERDNQVGRVVIRVDVEHQVGK